MISYFYLVNSHDFLDVILVSVMLYVLFLFIKQTKSFLVASAVVVLYLISFLSSYLNLSLARQLIQPVLSAVIVIFVVIFQKEIRRFFEWLHLAGRKLARERQITVSADVAHSVVKAVTEMSKNNIGALIVIPGLAPIDNLISGGTGLDGRVSSSLLLSIFNDQTPGHDGAVIIDHNRVRRFGVHLPLADQFDTKKAGTRHRAAVGLSERADALVIVVSEERGTISIARNGKLEVVKDLGAFESLLSGLMNVHVPKVSKPFYLSVFLHEWKLKLLAVLVASLLWFFFVFQIGVTQVDLVVPIEFRYLPKGYVLASGSVSEALVSVSGNTRDVRNIKPDDLKIVVDLNEVTLGKQRVTVDEADILHPNYLNVVKLTPSHVNIDVQTAE